MRLFPGKQKCAMFCHRGNSNAKRDEVTPGGIEAITTMDADFHLASNAPDAKRRPQAGKMGHG